MGPSEIAGDRVVIVATAAIVDCHAFMICSLCGLQPDAFAHGAGATINGTSPWERHNIHNPIDMSFSRSMYRFEQSTSRRTRCQGETKSIKKSKRTLAKQCYVLRGLQLWADNMEDGDEVHLDVENGEAQKSKAKK